VLLFVSIDDGCEDAGQVAVRFDLVQFAGLDQRREHGPVLRSSIVTGEECVLSLQGDGADGAFNGIVVHLDATVGEEQDQATQYLAMYLSACPVGDLADTCVRA
jgi:hypothetical protein